MNLGFEKFMRMRSASLKSVLPSMIPQYFKAAAAQMTLELAHFANIFPQKNGTRTSGRDLGLRKL